jgi:cytoskeletal protein RodZ
VVDAQGERDGKAEDAADRASIGRYLAAQRRLRGISLDELASSTKIPRRNLERLESGVFDGQADGFVRGFVRTVAEELGLDPHEAVMRLAREPRASEEEAHRRRVRALAVGIAVGVVLLAAVGWGIRLAARWLSEPAADAVDHVYRRDAVRSLIEERSADDAPTAAAEAGPSVGGEPTPDAGAVDGSGS